MLKHTVVSLSADASKVELRLVPNSHAPLDIDDILSLLSASEYKLLFPIHESIQKAVDEVNALGHQSAGKHELFFVIAERKDAQLKLSVSDDKMTAFMEVTAAWGGKALTLPDLLTSLKDAKIKKGLSKPKILAIVKRLELLAPGESFQGEIAFGTLPINGENAILSRKVALARERLLQPQEREDGTVDMRNLGEMITVKPGDILMVKIPATLGSPGFNVHGDILQQLPGKDLLLKAGEGAAIDPKDENKLIATVSGQPVETKTGMQVDDILQIKEVNVRFGHVNFKGSVLITGDVHEDMKVDATGDVTVMGFVDSGIVKAGGDVVVGKGIIGRLGKDHTLSTHVQAQGQICAQFVQYSTLKAEGDILVTKQLLHSHTTSGGQITIADPKATRGDLIGGIARAEKGIRAVAFGATAGTKTELYCAMSYNDLKQYVKDLDTSVKSLVVSSLEIEARLRKLPPKEQWQNDEAMVEQVKMMLEQKHLIAAERLKEEIEYDQLSKSVNNYFHDHFIKAEKQIYTNVELHIGDARQRTQRVHGLCAIKNVHNEVVFDYSHH